MGPTAASKFRDSRDPFAISGFDGLITVGMSGERLVCVKDTIVRHAPREADRNEVEIGTY